MKRTRCSGFTLVELMIVVAILGILAAIAIPAFQRYVKKARTAEVAGHLSKMWTGATAYYLSDHSDPSGTSLARQFPDSASAPYDTECACMSGERCPGNASRFDEPPWVALNFNVSGPHLFMPRYAASGVGANAVFTASTTGDLDCDGILSSFYRIGRASALDGDVAATPVAHSVNDGE